MTRWFAWYQAGDEGVPFFTVLIAGSLPVAEMMANDVASRDKVIVIGIIRAGEQFNPIEK